MKQPVNAHVTICPLERGLLSTLACIRLVPKCKKLQSLPTKCIQYHEGSGHVSKLTNHVIQWVREALHRQNGITKEGITELPIGGGDYWMN